MMTLFISHVLGRLLRHRITGESTNLFISAYDPGIILLSTHGLTGSGIFVKEEFYKNVTLTRMPKM